MRRMCQIVLAVLLGTALVGCGSAPASPATGGQTSTETAFPFSGESEGGVAPAPAEGTPEQIREQIEQDFADTQQALLDEQSTLFAEVGDSYEGYVANEQAVQAWYDLAVSETEALGARTLENAREYYRAVVATIDHGDQDALDDALDDFYDLIYDDAFDEYYDVIYDDGFDAAYDQYYDGVLDDAYDTVPYDEWYDVRSEAYDAWYDAKSDVYDAWYDAKSDVYDEWYDVNGGFFDNEFDIDEVLRLDEQTSA